MEIIIFCTYIIIENKEIMSNINRRDFLKRLGLGASVAGLAFAGCEKAAKKGSTH